MTEPQDRDIRRWLVPALSGVIVVVLAMIAVSPPTSGPLALLAIFLPHIIVGLLVVTALALVRGRSGPLAIALVAPGVLGVVALGGDWLSWSGVPPIGSAQTVRLVSWNLEAGSRPGTDYLGPLLDQDADIVALQELTPEAAAAIDGDAAIQQRWPYRLLMPEATVWGMGVLSRTPLSDPIPSADPVTLQVSTDVGGGRVVHLVNAHPERSPIDRVGPLNTPVGVQTAKRDARLDAIRRSIQRLLDAGAKVVAIGDFNVAPTEAGYRRIADGLLDVHAVVGGGPGWTWRPDSAEWTRAGLLRIDYTFVGPGIVPVATHLDCGLVGDHCLLSAEILVP